MSAIAFTAAALTRTKAFRDVATRAGAGLVCQLGEDASVSRAAVMRGYLARGPATQGQLARCAKLASAALVPVLLHHDLKTGRVEISDGLYWLNEI